MKNYYLLFLSVLLLSPAWGARSFNGTSDGAIIGCTGTAGNCSSSCIACTISPILNGTITDIDISFWLWENTWGTSDDVIMEQSLNYNNRNGTFFITGGGVPGGSCSTNSAFFSHNQAGDTHFRQRAFTHPSSGAWHHYLFVMDNAGSSWALYIDGVSQSLTNCDISLDASANFDVDGVSLMSRGNGASLWTAGKMARVALWYNVVLTANEAVSLASCTEPWLIRPESLAFYAPNYGGTSPEPSYALSLSGASSNFLTTETLTGTSSANDPPVCSGVDP